MVVVTKLGPLTCGITGKLCERRGIRKAVGAKTSPRVFHDHCMLVTKRGGLVKKFPSGIKNCGLINDQSVLDYELGSAGMDERFASTREQFINGSSQGVIVLKGNSTNQRQSQTVLTEHMMLSLPAIVGQAIEPLPQLMETAYIGGIGALQLASAGVSISIFNLVSKVFNIPILSVATSFVAEDISRHTSKESISVEKRPLPSVSTALVLAIGIGLFQAAALYLGSGVFLTMMGVSTSSPMRNPAQQILKLRAIGAPAVVVSLAIQGILRGFKDTRSPVLCLGLGNLSAAFLFPILMYVFGLGIKGAAISTVVSQYIVTFSMILYLNKRTILVLPSMEKLHFANYLRSGGFLLGRTLAAVVTITLSTSMAARLGALAMAAHQICMQIWLSLSLLADAQAASAQTGLFTGIFLAVILCISCNYLATLFTKDAEVLNIVRSGLLFVSASQPLNSLAYIFDGLYYGASDFTYAAASMMIVGAISSACIIYAPTTVGLPGIWFGLTLFMGLRIVAGYMRLSSNNGPWWLLQDIHETEIAN